MYIETTILWIYNFLILYVCPSQKKKKKKNYMDVFFLYTPAPTSLKS